VKIETSMGTIVVELYNETPKHRDNFIKLVQKGFYDGTLFHRVIREFMIQGGDPDSKNAKKGAWVHVYPNHATQGTLNPEMEKEGYTDSNGEVRFDFKYSAVLDVDVIDTTRYFNDSTFTYVVDSVYGHKIVKIETRRQGSKENIFREEVVVK
jgi:cyclophilin family peptidyl-prolyl cis-trans isomerase